MVAEAELVSPEGEFTELALTVLTAYADRWIAGARDLVLEREHPALAGSFYDVRSDPAYARQHASPPAETGVTVKPMKKAAVIEIGLAHNSEAVQKFVAEWKALDEAVKTVFTIPASSS